MGDEIRTLSRICDLILELDITFCTQVEDERGRAMLCVCLKLASTVQYLERSLLVISASNFKLN